MYVCKASFFPSFQHVLCAFLLSSLTPYLMGMSLVFLDPTCTLPKVLPYWDTSNVIFMKCYLTEPGEEHGSGLAAPVGLPVSRLTAPQWRKATGGGHLTHTHSPQSLPHGLTEAALQGWFIVKVCWVDCHPLTCLSLILYLIIELHVTFKPLYNCQCLSLFLHSCVGHIRPYVVTHTCIQQHLCNIKLIHLLAR